jgi:putative PIG3 family NAD(P)H quinone oxidoreductase
MQRAGRYPSPDGSSDLLGLEMSGVVEAVGEKVSRWQPGDRVFGLLGGGGYAEFVVLDERMAMPMPDNLSFEEAAAIPETFLTAYQALCWLGGLEANDRVLIHAGGSGVGTAAIQIADRLNCWIASTAGSDTKLGKIKSLGADLGINYKEQDFAAVISDELGDSSIDLVLDFIGRPYWHGNMEVLAQDGCVVYLAFLGGKKVDEVDLSKILFKRLTIKGSTLRNRDLDYKIELTRSFQEFAMSYLEEGSLHPVIDSSFDWTEVEQAHERMRQNKNIGKIVLNGM